MKGCDSMPFVPQVGKTVMHNMAVALTIARKEHVVLTFSFSSRNDSLVCPNAEVDPMTCHQTRNKKLSPPPDILSATVIDANPLKDVANGYHLRIL